MNAKQIIVERKKPLPNWASGLGVFADLKDWPDSVSYWCKCPKCGEEHGNFKTMREAHAKRLCPVCDIESVNKLKDYIATVDDPDQRDKPGKSTTKMFHEAQDPDDFDPMEMIDRTILGNWVTRAIYKLQQELDTHITPKKELPETDDEVNELEMVEVETDSGAEWTIYKDDDTAEKTAIEQVTRDLNDEPDLFNHDFLERHIDLDRLKNILLPDKDFRNEFSECYGDDDEQVDYLIKKGLLDEDDFFTPKGARRKMSPKRERLKEKAIDEWAEEQEKDFDPMDWLRDIYGRDEAFKEAIKIAGIDEEAAAKDAVNSDGWQHYLARYDGESTELDGGAVAVRTN